MLQNILLIQFNANPDEIHDKIKEIGVPFFKTKKSHLEELLEKELVPYVHVEMAYPDDDNFDDFLLGIYLHILSALERPLALNFPPESYTHDFFYKYTQALKVEKRNFLISPLPYRHALCLIFDKDDNPVLYTNELVKLLKDYFLDEFIKLHRPHSLEHSGHGQGLSWENISNKHGKIITTQSDDKITNLLLTLFVDLRRYSDEFEIIQQMHNHIQLYNNVPMIKAFVYGIDNAGKSSLMRLLSTNKFDPNYFQPTKKFRISSVNLESNARLICWDMPGHKIFREDWLRGAQASNILIFVLDIADPDRYSEAREALWYILNLYELQGLPLFFLANKIDLIEDFDFRKEEFRRNLTDYFHLEQITGRSFTFLFTSLPERYGIEQLLRNINNECNRLLLLNGFEITNSENLNI